MDSESKRAFLWRAVAGLLVLQGLLWFVLSSITFWRRSEALAISATFSIIFGVLMIGNGLLMLLLAWGCYLERLWVRNAALAYIVLNTLLTITDQFGWFDLAILIINLATLVALTASVFRVRRSPPSPLATEGRGGGPGHVVRERRGGGAKTF